MKTVLALVLIIFSTGLLSAQNVQKTFSEGQRAFLAGDFATAREKFDAVLATHPKHEASLKYIGMIAARDKSGGPAAAQQKKLASIVFPVINFREADLESVLEFLKAEGEKLGGEGTQINFVSQVPAADAKSVSLSLSGIPFPQVLRYVGQLAGVEFIVEQHAILVRPPGQQPAPVPAADSMDE